MECLNCHNQLIPYDKWDKVIKRKFCSIKCTTIYKRAHPEIYNKNFGKPRRTIEEIKYYRYKASAIQRSLPFEITFEEFMTYWGKPCYYCDSEVHTIGLDRVNSKLGYISSNIVPCCSICNWIKGPWDKDLFIEKCKKIASRF